MQHAIIMPILYSLQRQHGKFIKIKIKTNNENEYTIACAYIETTMEQHPEIIPQEIN